MQHLLTEEEASLVRHLGLLAGRSAAGLARAEHRPLDQVEPILRRLSEEKRVIVRSGADGKARYRLMPIMPGMFEMVLVSPSPDGLTDWHRRFAELFEALYETGYMGDYAGPTTPWVRFLPVGKAIEAHPLALPSDHLEVVLDQFDAFGVGQCQCRIATEAVGRGCGKPKGNCAVMGKWAKGAIKMGAFRQVSKQEMLDIKREAEAHGMVNWIMNVAATKGQCSCSCCGCCCHAMRTIKEFNAAGDGCPAAFFAPAGAGPVRLLRPLRGGLPHGRPDRRRQGEEPGGIARSVASAAGCARWRARRSGPSPWSPCPTTSCPTRVGLPCSAGRCRRC